MWHTLHLQVFSTFYEFGLNKEKKNPIISSENTPAVLDFVL